jgi:hypothetical protein
VLANFLMMSDGIDWNNNKNESLSYQQQHVHRKEGDMSQEASKYWYEPHYQPECRVCGDKQLKCEGTNTILVPTGTHLSTIVFAVSSLTFHTCGIGWQALVKSVFDKQNNRSTLDIVAALPPSSYGCNNQSNGMIR